MGLTLSHNLSFLTEKSTTLRYFYLKNLLILPHLQDSNLYKINAGIDSLAVDVVVSTDGIVKKFGSNADKKKNAYFMI